MRNKLIILTFALSLACVSLAQSPNNASEQAKINIYPNPAVEFIVVEVDRSLEKVEFELNSMIGNKIIIEPEEIGIGKYRIPVKEFATGYYFLIVKDEDARFKKAYKFLKS